MCQENKNCCRTKAVGKRTGLPRLNVSRWEEKRRKNLPQRQIRAGISDTQIWAGISGQWGWEIAGQCWASESKYKGNGVTKCSHHCTYAKEVEKSPKGTRTWLMQMQVTRKGEGWKVSYYFTQFTAHLATGTTNPHIAVCQPFFHQDNTNHLQLSNMFTQSLSHMFLWPMCQQSEQLPIKVLPKSSKWKPGCHAWCDTMATQSPHHDWTLRVLGRVSQSTTSTGGPIRVGDAGTQTNVNILVWTTERRGGDREGSLGL